MTKEEFKQVIRNVTVRRRARDEKQVQDAIEFLYTWWVNPDNSTARRKMLIDVSSLFDSLALSHFCSSLIKGLGVVCPQFVGTKRTRNSQELLSIKLTAHIQTDQL